MKYADLIQFQPIESVIQLREADKTTDARNLVETFVISDRMAELLTGLVFPQLQFDKPADTKGLLIVGNYGTGKSHLMAVISAIAEHADMASAATNAAVASQATAIAGRFKVFRAEIGATTMTLRDIVCGTIEGKLGAIGVDYQFPQAGEVTNNKDAFSEMMAVFEKLYPNQGLLLVLDELLDYLRTRTEPELILDLNFLRELGEICKSTRFRFISGVQESLFDSPRFQFVATTLRRAKDRFEQVRIAREDVAYVVSRRLLKKTPEQQGRIREHLTQFAPLYGSMNEQMDAFVELFPVHPAYLDTFEKVYVAEKREILKTLSTAIRDVIDQDVPDAEPGLIAYDGYWTQLKNNPSFRSVPEIKEVIDKSSVLEGRIRQAYTQPRYKDVALRVINALSVHRLTTDDIFASIGATPEELRDDLCLILPTPEKEAGFLKTLVEKVLAEILRTVSGQFITRNKENNQYYLDLKKNVDFDALIERKADTLSDEQLDRHYFTALAQVLEVAENDIYVSGYRIWEHELEWRERKTGRSGYLFFGAPNQRSTAQPPRDFYLYFLQPLDAPYYKDEKRPDEVFFNLKHRDERFDTCLRLYAGAREQAATASGENKRIYEQKANDSLNELTQWLRERMTTAFEVTSQGRSRILQEVIQGKIPGGSGRLSVRGLVNIAGSVCLSSEFENQTPDYPIFGVLITRSNREQAAGEALRWIAGGVKSKQGGAVLDALDLLDGDQLRPRQSRYANYVLDLLAGKKGQVLNRAELVQDEHGIDYWTPFRLEPEFLVVVLASLVHSGALVLSLPGKKLGAGSVDDFASFKMKDMVHFKHVEKPKGLPIEPLKELFTLLGLSQAQLVSESDRAREAAVNALQREVISQLDKLVKAQAHLQNGLSFWGQSILSEQEASEWGNKLRTTKEFIESLQKFNTVGKLNNFSYDVDTVVGQKTGLDRVREVDDLMKLIEEVGPHAAYLAQAETILPREHPWREKVREARGDLLTKLGNPVHRANDSFQRRLAQTLGELKASYQDAYLALHHKAHLGAKDDEKKATLAKDTRLRKLQQLDAVEIMPHQQLKSFQNTLFSLKTCFALSRKDLDASPECPHMSYRPVENPKEGESAPQILASLDERLDELLADWTRTLLSNLEDPTVGENIALISSTAGKNALMAFMESRTLPDPISPAFVKALQDALTGLEKVAVTETDLREALEQGGTPCTVKEFRGRFDAYVTELTRGKDTNKVRVVVE